MIDWKTSYRLFLFASAALLACGGGGDGDGGSVGADAGASADASIDAPPVPAEIAEYLANIDGLTVSEESTVYNGYRRFVLTYTQPLDHSQPDGKMFEQRAVLHHRERARPFVLYTSGYYLFTDDSLSELAGSMQANQLDVEQRFFAPSTPSPTLAADWQYMRIEQAAADHHRFVEALAPYYTAAWVSTGHSKGGMTSVYHRRFYPDDVDATVAYVAPISFSAGDTRYHSFFDEVADAACRQALRDVQRELLLRRAAIQTRLEASISGSGITFDRVGGIEAAIEDGVIGMPWSFFQGGSAANCPDIPDANATDDALYNFWLSRGGPSTDGSIETFSTYYYQAEVELGYPSIPTEHLNDLLQFTDVEQDFMPEGVTGNHDPAAMADIDSWLKGEGSEVLFVYGEFDPWFGGAFELGTQTEDSFKLVVAGANHGAVIRGLAPAERDVALSAIERWTGVRPSITTSRQAAPAELPHLRVRMHMR